jgi:dihydroorotate dehydrogenase electron transfer subunit
MKNGEGQVFEIYLDSRIHIHCPPDLIPAPGQYLLAHARGSDSPLAVPLFFSDSAPNGFRSAPLVDSPWQPGTHLNLRGPLGRGFLIPAFARKVALIVFDDSPSRLRGLIPLALKQGAEVVLVSNTALEDISEEVEVQPLQAMFEIYRWADFAAFDMERENLIHLKENFGKLDQAKAPREAQILVRTPMPCGALAECGVCALTIHHEWKMICKDGPVFEMKELL